MTKVLIHTRDAADLGRQQHEAAVQRAGKVLRHDGRWAAACRAAAMLRCILCTATSARAADGDYVWAKQMGGSGIDRGQSMDVDSNGNVYTTGYFQRTVDFPTTSAPARFVLEGKAAI